MKSCWSTDPASRPTFAQISKKLSTLLESADLEYGYVDAVRSTSSLKESETDDDENVTQSASDN